MSGIENEDGDREPMRYPDPAGRRRGDATGGIPVTLGGGATWELPPASKARALDALRDRVFDEQTLTGKVALADVHEAAYLLLWASYELEPGEILGLLAGADPRGLADAVMEAFFGREAGRRTYSEWVRSALLANGLDPASIPAEDLPNVLRHLVRTGRAEEAGSFISSVEAAGKRKRLLESLGR